MPRHAFSLMEVIIAIALFATLLVGVLEAALSVRQFADQHEALLDLEQEGRLILSQVTSDLSNSGWLKTDSGTVLYPVVSPPLVNGLPVIDPEFLPFGNQVEFLRINSSHGATGSDWCDFSTPTTPMDQWKTPDNAIPELVSDPDYTTQVGRRLVTPVWETTSSNSTAQLTYENNQIVSNLRVYVYQAELSPSGSGRGTLRRYYRDGGVGALVRDPRLGDLGSHIYSFLVTPVNGTQRIQVTLELRNDVPGKARAVRTFIANIAMRSAY
jgi:prepilin-type N-terminal cleavage/methylation domain-containing protein